MHREHSTRSISRREFVAASAAAAASALTGCQSAGPTHLGAVTAGPKASNATLASVTPSRLHVGVIGCGGRGTGAAANALEASPNVHITALADVFPERLASCREALATLPPEQSQRVKVADNDCFAGFDGYRALLDRDLDVVILATPPGFRPVHLAAAVAARKHVFLEKPVAVDPVGVRSVLASADVADREGLRIVAGTQRRHELSYLEAMRQVASGAIGRIVSGSCYWNQGGLWMHQRQPAWSDMEWQLRNWLYFTWLSGDHIVEQHVHNIDVLNWALGAHPLRATGMGGRQSRTDAAYGHVFDHFAVEYEYPDGVSVTSMCRQIDGCASRVEEVLRGVDGTCITSIGQARIEPIGSASSSWRFAGTNNNPYVQEHVDLYEAIAAGRPLNEARAVAESTLTAIMGRMSAYTGKTVTWEQAMNSSLDLTPPGELTLTRTLPVPPVAMPGRTPLA